ncbi:primosomal replication protein PriC [Orbus sturtevantii]|uniref:primosomal replication protein PriC n=1 Tax=Orbus sturtevantii TaxID=3074109 RepID=UPI00370D9D35
MTQNDIFLAKLNDNITSLSQQFAAFSTNKIYEPCFDAQLFNYQGVLLNGYAPYLLELQTNYQKLAKLIAKENQSNYLDQIVYLSDLLVKQIAALQRELSTRLLRYKKERSVKETSPHEEYAKNVGYLNRLEAMKYKLQQDLCLQPSEQAKQIAAVEQRIANCRHALILIEQKIEQANE